MYTNNESNIPESAMGHYKTNDHAAGKIKTSSKVMRLITLCLQIVSILAYYVPSIVNRGEVGILWLALGVVQTVVFCIVFFRDERTRLITSIVLMVLGTLFHLAMILFIGFYAYLGLEMGLNFSTAFIYVLCSMVALIFALCFPRRFQKQQHFRHQPHGVTYF